jgi:hypothetical protein
MFVLCGLMLASCSDDNDNTNPDQPVVLNCVQPAYLKTGDKVALISPSYFTPMENVENTADIISPPTPAAARMRMAGKME